MAAGGWNKSVLAHLMASWSYPGSLSPAYNRGPKDHINVRISHSGSKAQNKGDTRIHGLWDPYVHVVVWSAMYCLRTSACALLLSCCYAAVAFEMNSAYSPS